MSRSAVSSNGHLPDETPGHAHVESLRVFLRGTETAVLSPEGTAIFGRTSYCESRSSGTKVGLAVARPPGEALNFGSRYLSYVAPLERSFSCHPDANASGRRL